MIDRTRLTLRLSAEYAEKLSSASKSSGLSRNELIHDAIDLVIARENANATTLIRIAQTTEFIQTAIDLMVKRDMPGERNGIMLSVAKRMEQFHGSR